MLSVQQNKHYEQTERRGPIILTTDVFLHPCKCNAPFLAALTEAQEKRAGWFWTKNGPLPLFTDKAQDVPVERRQKAQQTLK